MDTAVLEKKATGLGLESADLDEFVHEIASGVAAEINNQGIERQIAYWMDEGGLDIAAVELELRIIARAKQRRGQIRTDVE